MFPDDLRYSTDHEWIRVEGRTATVGITDFAQEQLGDIVFVSLPTVGESVAPGAVIGELESTKSVSDLFAPISGEVLARNEALDTSPELVNSDPYGQGWLISISMSDPDAAAELLDAASYQASLK